MKLTKKMDRLVDAVQSLLKVTGWCDPEELGLADELAFLEEAVADVLNCKIESSSLGGDKGEVFCKGRNGWFSFGQANIFGSNESAWVEVFSTRIGREAPIIFRGNPNDLIEVFEEVLGKLWETTEGQGTERHALCLRQYSETDFVKSVEVRVKATAENLHELDKTVPGTYSIKFEAPLQKNEAVNAALDEFHETVPIKVLEDFDIAVYDSCGVELT